jgi:uncharacterized protein YdcH (DUF465 family)
MFEFDQKVVDALLAEDNNFRRLYEKYNGLKEQVRQANAGVAPLDDISLENLKKQKLVLKDQMAAIISGYRSAATA